MSDALVEEVSALVRVFDKGAQIVFEIGELGHTALRSLSLVIVWYHLNSRTGYIISKLLHDIGFKLLSRANASLSLLICTIFLMLSYIFSFLLKLFLWRFIFFSNIDIDVNTREHILHSLHIYFFLPAFTEVICGRIEQF